jgi:hypothetical protein
MISEELQELLFKYCEPEDELLQHIDRETQLKSFNATHVKWALPRPCFKHAQ